MAAIGYQHFVYNDRALLASGPSTDITDLMAAVVAALRASPDLETALDEDTSDPRTTKIWADNMAMGQPDPPYLTYSEPDEDLSPESPDAFGVVHYFGHGKFTLALTDTSKINARTTSKLIVSLLNDAPLVFPDGILLELRHTNPECPTVPSVAPNSPVTYQRVLEFEYVVQRTF